MRRVGGKFVLVVAVLAVAVVGSAADDVPLLDNSAPGGAEAKVVADAASVEAAGRTLALRPGREVSSATVVVIGPDDIRFERRVEGEPELVLALEGPDGEALSDGTYRYELRMSMPGGVAGEPEVTIQRGAFKMRNGSVLLPDPAEGRLQGHHQTQGGGRISTGPVEGSGRVEATAGDSGTGEPVAKSAIHHPGDVSIDGRLCVSCTAPENPFWEVDVRGANIITFETSDSGDVTQKDWDFYPDWIQDAMVFRLPGPTFPFSVHQDAPTGSFAVRSNGDVTFSGGNVGIGTTTPARPLHLVTSLGNPDIRFDEPSGNSYRIDPGSDGYWIRTTAAGFSERNSVQIQAGTPSATIRTTVDGNVGIGLDNPTERLHVFNGVGNASLLFDSAASANFFLDRGNTSSFSRFVFETNGALKWSMGMVNDVSDNFTLGPNASISYFFVNHTNGRIGMGTKAPAHPLQMASGAHVTAGGVWTNVSSRKHKENIRDLDAEEALSALAGMNPVQFNYKNSPEEDYIGFIAEEVPAIVAMEDREGLSPMDLVGVLTKVVQEQQKLLQQQQQTISSLTSRVEELEAR